MRMISWRFASLFKKMSLPDSAKNPGSTNLFQGDWTSAKIEAVLTRHPRQPLLPQMDSAEWRRAAENPLVQKLAAPLRQLAEEECGEALPLLTDKLYAHFKQTGVRLTFENVYFERRRRLARAALSLVLAGNDDPWRDRLSGSVREKFQDIFEEISWALPAHANWHNDDQSGKEPMQIDLFCAETANLMAEILDVFGSLIPSVLQARVRERLQSSIFENYLRRDFHWMEVTHNWNAVCHQGVVGAALSQLEDPHQLAAILMRMRDRLPHFLQGYGPNGGCSEGPGYWSYGFGWFTVLNEQLETRTGGELSLFEGDDHIREIALYGPRMALSGGHLVNFADGAPSGGLRPAILCDLGERLGLAECRATGLDNYRRLLREGIDWKAERADVFSLLRAMLRCPMDLPAAEGPMAKDCFLPDLAVVVARGKDNRGHLWEFAAKGGHNGEHHNHNDCGSYILNMDGIRFITEIGAPEYVHDFFGSHRYEFLAARSLGHSVPLINGCEQSCGSAFAAAVLSVALSEDQVEFMVDLTRCYPPEALCRRLQRTFLFEKSAGRLTVTDDYELDGPGVVEVMLICRDPVTQQGGEVLISAPAAVLRIKPAAGVRLLADETCSYQGHGGEAEHIQRLRFAFGGAATTTGKITLTLSRDT